MVIMATKFVLKSLHQLSGLASALFLVLACHAINGTLGNQMTSTTNQNINISNQEETIKTGNVKTNNYNIYENHYKPIQDTKLVVNVGKFKNKNKLRTTRPPTADELDLKRHILAIHRMAVNELIEQFGFTSTNLQHLGRILTALNPKYISTKRVMEATYSSQFDFQVVPPEAEFITSPKQLHSEVESYSNTEEGTIKLSGGSTVPIQVQLNSLEAKFNSFVSWDEDFLKNLFEISDHELTTNQLAFKQLFKCLSHPALCKSSKFVKKVKKKDSSKSISQKNDALVQQALEAEEANLSLEPYKIEEPQDASPLEQLNLGESVLTSLNYNQQTPQIELKPPLTVHPQHEEKQKPFNKYGLGRNLQSEYGKSRTPNSEYNTERKWETHNQQPVDFRGQSNYVKEASQIRGLRYFDAFQRDARLLDRSRN